MVKRNLRANDDPSGEYSQYKYVTDRLPPILLGHLPYPISEEARKQEGEIVRTAREYDFLRSKKKPKHSTNLLDV